MKFRTNNPKSDWSHNHHPLWQFLYLNILKKSFVMLFKTFRNGLSPNFMNFPLLVQLRSYEPENISNKADTN